MTPWFVQVRRDGKRIVIARCASADLANVLASYLWERDGVSVEVVRRDGPRFERK